MINIDKLAREFANTVSGQTPDLAHAALLIARLEHPLLNPKPSLECLDRMGVEARQRLADGGGKTQRTQFEILSRYLFRERGFTGNPNDHEDPRNSCLNQVLDRRTGIPVTLGIVFLEVAKRAGVEERVFERRGSVFQVISWYDYKRNHRSGTSCHLSSTRPIAAG